jgi:hypothetical protein
LKTELREFTASKKIDINDADIIQKNLMADLQKLGNKNRKCRVCTGNDGCQYESLVKFSISEVIKDISEGQLPLNSYEFSSDKRKEFIKKMK